MYEMNYCISPFFRGHHIFAVLAVGIESAKISRPRFRASYMLREVRLHSSVSIKVNNWLPPI